MTGNAARHIARLIEAQGPIPVSLYMAEALTHPQYGYYETREPFGVSGDFITAPEISQMFGELVGLWLGHMWDEAGRPPDVRIVELGPGRGTLMADMLRAFRVVPGLLDHAEIHLVEASPRLAEIQKETLGSARRGARSPAVTWHRAFEEIPAGPFLLVANEFFDALPVRQFEKTAAGWRERLVALAAGDAFSFVLAGEPPEDETLIPEPVRSAPVGSIAEVSPRARALARTIARRLSGVPGAALIVDYGPARSAPGDSMQAVKAHRYHDPLEAPGEADITAHVDFESLIREARFEGTAVFGPVGQGAFLEALGIETRCALLRKTAPAHQALGLERALDRLTAPDQMGDLFKALAMVSPGLGLPPGFGSPDQDPMGVRERPR